MKSWKQFLAETPKRKISIESCQIDKALHREIQDDAFLGDVYEVAVSALSAHWTEKFLRSRSGDPIVQRAITNLLRLKEKRRPS